MRAIVGLKLTLLSRYGNLFISHCLYDAMVLYTTVQEAIPSE